MFRLRHYGWLLLLWRVGGFTLGGESGPRVGICQHKDCCRQWTHTQSLPETWQDLLPPDTQVQVEASGCLGECGQGPNVLLHAAGANDPVLVHGLSTPLDVAAALEQHFDMRVPSKLLAAVTVLDKARKGTSLQLYGYNIRVASKLVW